jgi:hypothetical protein
MAPAENASTSDASVTPTAMLRSGGDSQLSLKEMATIMDVASQLRREQAVVQQQLNLDQVKQALRQRLLDAATLSGGSVTAEQVDAAVAQYYDQLHTYREPGFGWSTAVAHMWIRRRMLGAVVLGVLGVWLLYLALLYSGWLPGAIRDERLAKQQFERIETQLAAIEKLSDQGDILERVRTARQAADGWLAQRSVWPLSELAAELESLAERLAAEYTVSIVAAPGEQSGIERLYNDESGTRLSGCYVFVEARDPLGKLVTLPITNRETGKVERVTRWGEQVPQEVFERLLEDKRADGVLDETRFAVKKRGRAEMDMVLPDATGWPVSRQGQITRW